MIGRVAQVLPDARQPRRDPYFAAAFDRERPVAELAPRLGLRIRRTQTLIDQVVGALADVCVDFASQLVGRASAGQPAPDAHDSCAFMTLVMPDNSRSNADTFRFELLPASPGQLVDTHLPVAR